MAGKAPYIEIDIAGDASDDLKREKKEKEGSCGGLFSGRCCGKHRGERGEAPEAAEHGASDEAGENDRLYRVVAQMYSQMLTLKGRTSYVGAKGPQKKH